MAYSALPSLFSAPLAVLSLLGAVGAWLLLNTPSSVFARLVPWLVLFATSVNSLRQKQQAIGASP